MLRLNTGAAVIAVSSRTLADIISLPLTICYSSVALGRVTASGKTGLSAFLPLAEQRMPGEAPVDAAQPLPPHLPLVADFQRGDFTLSNVANLTRWSGKSRRAFAVSLIQRYQYALSMSECQSKLSCKLLY